MHLEADAELEEIDPDVRHVPEVLAVRVQIYHGLKIWDLLQAVAKKLAQFDPENAQWTISWAYATRRADSIEAVRLILVHALKAVLKKGKVQAQFQLLRGPVLQLVEA